MPRSTAGYGRRASPRSLREALEELDGPIVDRTAARAAAQERWSAVAAQCHHPMLAGYLQNPAALGLLKRLARQDAERAGQLVKQAEAVLRRLPAAGLPRAQLAADTLGNSHALDNGQATATLVLGAWRCFEALPPDLPEPAGEGGERDENARAVWARAGVAVNELARPALFLNLPVEAGELPAATAGEPAYVSLRQLLRAPPAWAVAGREIFVCENPNLVAIAADQLGPRCRPLVSTDGAPGATQRTLLTQLARAGARLAYHGDFDWPGLRIANHLIAVHGAAPGDSAPPNTRRRSSERRIRSAIWPELRSKPAGTRRWHRRCSATAWPSPRKPWRPRCWRICELRELSRGFHLASPRSEEQRVVEIAVLEGAGHAADLRGSRSDVLGHFSPGRSRFGDTADAGLR